MTAFTLALDMFLTCTCSMHCCLFYQLHLYDVMLTPLRSSTSMTVRPSYRPSYETVCRVLSSETTGPEILVVSSTWASRTGMLGRCGRWSANRRAFGTSVSMGGKTFGRVVLTCKNRGVSSNLDWNICVDWVEGRRVCFPRPVRSVVSDS